MVCMQARTACNSSVKERDALYTELHSLGTMFKAKHDKLQEQVGRLSVPASMHGIVHCRAFRCTLLLWIVNLHMSRVPWMLVAYQYTCAVLLWLCCQLPVALVVLLPHRCRQ